VHEAVPMVLQRKSRICALSARECAWMLNDVVLKCL